MPRLLFICDRVPGDPRARRLGATFDPLRVEELKQYTERLEADWRPIEPQVFDAFTSLTGRPSKREAYDCFIVASMEISGYTYLRSGRPSIAVRAEPDFTFLRTSLIHELAHVFVADNPLWRLRLLPRLWLLHPTTKLARITDHLLVNTLHQEVARRILPNAEQALAVTKQWRGLRRAWQIVEHEEVRLRRLVVR